MIPDVVTSLVTAIIAALITTLLVQTQVYQEVLDLGLTHHVHFHLIFMIQMITSHQVGHMCQLIIDG